MLELGQLLMLVLEVEVRVRRDVLHAGLAGRNSTVPEQRSIAWLLGQRHLRGWRGAEAGLARNELL